MTEPPGTAPQRDLSPAWEVTCESCQQRYVFLGDADSVGPCPHCGWIQKSMYRAARGKRGAWLLTAGLIVLCLAGIGMLPAMSASMERRAAPAEGFSQAAILWIIDLALAVAGVLMLLLGWWRRASYDPNSLSQQERLAWGQRVSLTWETYERLLREAGKPVPKATLFDNLLTFLKADEIATAAEPVTCEKCQRAYVYFPRIEPTAPCPHCGQIQKYMWMAASSGSWWRLLLAGLVCLSLAGFCLLPTIAIGLERRDPGGDRVGKLTAFALVITVLAGSGGLLLWLSWRHRYHDNLNNRSQQERLVWAARRTSLTPEEYEWVLEEAEQREARAAAVETAFSTRPLSPQRPDEQVPDSEREEQPAPVPPIHQLIDQDNRLYGWIYTISGPILFVGGLVSLIDPTAPRVYLGAFLVGPILFFRGLYLLRHS